jgi:hypothetical protein
MLNDTLSKIAKLTLPNTKPSLSQFFFPPQDLWFIVNAIGTMLNAVLGISDKVIPIYTLINFMVFDKVIFDEVTDSALNLYNLNSTFFVFWRASVRFS